MGARALSATFGLLLLSLAMVQAPSCNFPVGETINYSNARYGFTGALMILAASGQFIGWQTISTCKLDFNGTISYTNTSALTGIFYQTTPYCSWMPDTATCEAFCTQARYTLSSGNVTFDGVTCNTGTIDTTGGLVVLDFYIGNSTLPPTTTPSSAAAFTKCLGFLSLMLIAVAALSYP